MSTAKNATQSRRLFLTSVAATGLLAAPALVHAQGNSTEFRRELSGRVKRNASSFRMLDWRPYFETLEHGAILCDLPSRALHFWNERGEYRLYPTSVPMSEDLTRRGRTEITRKVEGPTWRPTPAMKERNPEWPDVVEAGPDNPLGTHALYLSWTYYRIHGTQDTRKIGRRSSNGCIGLYNEHIAELYQMAKVKTQVLLI